MFGEIVIDLEQTTQREYKIDLDVRGEKGVIFDIKRRLQNSFKAYGLPSTVEISADKKSLTVKTEISQDHLESFLQKYANQRKGFLRSYTIC